MIRILFDLLLELIDAILAPFAWALDRSFLAWFAMIMGLSTVVTGALVLVALLATQ